jgi:DNA-binding transcriptional regulator GbsR (MarR family)
LVRESAKINIFISVLTEIKERRKFLAMELTPVTKRFVLHWGEMGTTWGVNRTVAQIHALLFILGRPLNADEITETLGVARSNVSMSLRELQNWNLIRTVPLLGDRRDHFMTTTDVWELFRTVVRERKLREFDPTIVELRECLSSPDIYREDAAAQMRIKETLALMESLSSWADEMIRLDPATLVKVIKMGAKVQQFVRGKPGDASVSPKSKNAVA